MDSVYTERPWLARYPSHVPADLEPPFASGVEMFRATARRVPDRPAVHYFERTITFGELARLASSTCCACGMASAPAVCAACPGLELLSAVLREGRAHAA